MRLRSAPSLVFALLACLAPAAANQTAGGGKGGAPAAASSASDGKKLFLEGTTPSCATCHALKDAGATGNVGPDLDALRPDAERVARAVKEGFEAMPPFGHVLSDAQIRTLSQYVAKASGGR
jgi:sulfite dehydrogenase